MKDSDNERVTGKKLGKSYILGKIFDIKENRKLLLASPYYRLSLFDGSDESATNEFDPGYFYQAQEEISYDIKELKTFGFYVDLEKQISLIENDLIYFIQDFNHNIEMLASVQAQLKMNRKINNVLSKAGLLEDTMNDCIDDAMFSIEKDDLFFRKEQKQFISFAYRNICYDLTFFNAMNFVYTKLDEYLGLDSLFLIMVETETYEQAIKEINSTFEELSKNESFRKIIDIYYEPFAIASCIPDENKALEILNRIDLRKGSDDFYVERLEEAVLEIGYRCSRKE